MNNVMKKFMVSGLAALVVCSSSFAAPVHKAEKSRAPVQVVQKSHAVKPAQKPVKEVKHHKPSKPQQPKPQSHKVEHHHVSRHDSHDYENAGYALLGALLGSLVCALVS